jgi:hypothetical protein
VRYSHGESHQIWILKADGSEQTQALPEGMVTTRTKWDSDRLVTEGYDGGHVVVREVREIDPKGRMVVMISYESDDGPGEARAVYVKK